MDVDGVVDGLLGRPHLQDSNPHLDKLESDYLYHFGYSRDDKNPSLKERFSDVKFVVVGGSWNRMGGFAEFLAKELGHPHEKKEELSISKEGMDRFAIYKIGPVLSVSHGMGVPSMTIMLHEIIKMLYYAGAKDATIIRMGTSGGIGVPPGTVVITNKAVNAFLKEEHETVVLGQKVTRPCVFDQQLLQSILDCQNDNSFLTRLGGTMCTDDFYEGQGRLDGAICEFSETDKMAYLQRVKEAGVVNIEMECVALGALCHRVGVKCAVVCVTLVDRLLGDQVQVTPDDYKRFQRRPQALVAKFIKAQLGT